MALRILIFHDLKIIRNLIKNYILTEYHDAIVDMELPKDAFKMLEIMKYDVVLCDQELADMEAIAVRDRMLNTNTNRKTPFILMTSTYNEALRDRLLKQGIKHILTIPFTALQLRDIINEVSDPRKRRAFTRYIIPTSKATISLKDKNIQADVINISLNGILCEFICPTYAPDIIKPCLLTLQFPSEYSPDLAKDIFGKLIRFNAESWSEDGYPLRIRISWEFFRVSTGAKKILEKVFEKANSEIIAAEEMVKIAT